MKIIFHGAAQEVGKSCIEIISRGRRYLLDAGVKFVHGGVEYPKYLDKVSELDAIFLSHAHMDHCGALPMLEHKRLKCPIYCTKMTWDIANILLEDGFHLEKLRSIHPAYSVRDVRAVKDDVNLVRYSKWYETKDRKVKFQYINAGHIPGSASILLEIEEKRVLYAADINTEETLLMQPSLLEKLEFDKPIDVLITENTYGNRLHPNKTDVQEGFIKSVMSGIEGEGSVLLPVFGVGRSQEILILLSKLPKNIPIYLDGSARILTKFIYQSSDPFINNKDILENMFKRVHLVKHPNERAKIAKQKGVVILTTSGMLQGGPSVGYAEMMINDKNNFIILSGFQANGTNGRSIFEDHIFYNHHQRFKVHAHVRKFDFSAHIGQDGIHKVMKNLKAKYILLQHGDIDALEAVKQWGDRHKDEVPSDVIIPRIGEELEF
ncbi:MAG: MBL fold metallo-hydrolase [Candidatus Woesearchaeota archaeon]